MNAREKILRAADRVFGEMGFDAATVRRIAEISRTNKALVHYHFKSKGGLFESVLDHYFEELSDRLQKTLIADLPLPDRMNRLFDRYIEFLEKNKNFIHIIHREINGGKQMQRVVNHMTNNFAKTISSGQELSKR